MSGTLELYSDVNAAGLNTILIDPVNPTSGQTYSLSLFDVVISFEATASTDNNIVTGLKAAIEASEDENWMNVTATVVNDSGNADASGDRLLLTYSSASGITRIWRGDSPPVAQVTTVTVANVSNGDVFSLIINGKLLTYTATASTEANVTAGLLAAIEASTLPEFGDFTATADGAVLTLTAATAGVPFTVTTTAASGLGVVTVAETQAPQVGTQRRFEWVVPDTFTTFVVRYRGTSTSALTTATVDASTIETALDLNSNIANSDATITTLSTGRKFVVLWDDDGSDALPVVASGALVLSVATTAAGPPEVQTLSMSDVTIGPKTENSTYTLTLEGYTTAPIAYAASAADIKAAIEALPNIAADTITVGERIVSGSTATQTITFASGYGDVTLMSAAWVVEPTDSVVTVTQTQEGVASLNQKYSVTIDADGGTYTLTAGGQTTSALAYNASIGTVETAIEALSSVAAATVTGTADSYVVEFVGDLVETAVVMTANGANLTGGGTESLTVATPTASKGPNHWDDAQNWTPEGVPADGDIVSFEIGNVDCLYGLDQSGILLTEFKASLSYGGQIGLPRLNLNGGFYEYRQRDLKIGATSILIGHGEGGGSGKIQIDTGADRTTIVVRGTGGGTESGVPAFTWRGSNTLNSVTVFGGEFGTAIFSDQTSRIATYTQRGGSGVLNNATITTIDAPGQTLRAHNCNLGGNRIEL